jgi:hypothetical protein
MQYPRYVPKLRKKFSNALHGVILTTRFFSGYGAVAKRLRASVLRAPISRTMTSVCFRVMKYLVVKRLAADTDGKVPVTS